MAGKHYTRPLKVPFHREFPENELKPGQSVCVKGLMLGERFDINLRRQHGNENDIPLHCSIRQDEGKIVLNDKREGGWGEEQRLKLPFKDGEEFEIRLRAIDTGYEIFCNTQELGIFEHRQALNAIRCIDVDGAVELYRVSIEGGFYSMPYYTALSGIRPGQQLRVTGQVDRKANRFEINLLQGEDYVLHFNPRFDEKVIVRNSKQGGSWMNEERQQEEFPLKKDRAFEIVFECTDSAFVCYIDDTVYCEFAHRVNPGSITQFAVEGDVELQAVQLS